MWEVLEKRRQERPSPSFGVFVCPSSALHKGKYEGRCSICMLYSARWRVRKKPCPIDAGWMQYTIVPLSTDHCNHDCINKVVRHATPMRGGLCYRTEPREVRGPGAAYALHPTRPHATCQPPAPRSHSPASARPKFDTCASATRCRGLRVSFRIRRIHSSPTDRRTRGAVELAKNGVLPQLPSLLTYELMTRFM